MAWHRIGAAWAAIALAFGLLALVSPDLAHAEALRPLLTESAAVLPSGRVDISLGATVEEDGRFPAFTGVGALRSQQLVRGPQVEVRVGAGDWAEVQAALEMRALEETAVTGDHAEHVGVGDALLHSKFRVLRERRWRPGVGVRFGATLPNANRGDRLGTDETDFDVAVLASKQAGPLSLHVNLGVELLGNPGPMLGAPARQGTGQDDLFTYAVGVMSPPFAAGAGWELRLAGEVVGRDGSRFGNNRAVVGAGVSARRGDWTLFAAARVGLIIDSEDVGGSGGIAYAFDVARLFNGAD
jgi:hypothetical protein